MNDNQFFNDRIHYFLENDDTCIQWRYALKSLLKADFDEEAFRKYIESFGLSYVRDIDVETYEAIITVRR